jgi:hypothetical protein
MVVDTHSIRYSIDMYCKFFMDNLDTLSSCFF